MHLHECVILVRPLVSASSRFQTLHIAHILCKPICTYILCKFYANFMHILCKPCILHIFHFRPLYLFDLDPELEQAAYCCSAEKIAEIQFF